MQCSQSYFGVSETACLLVIYNARKCEFICSIVEAEIKPDGRSVYKVNHFGAPGVKFWWRNSHVCRDHFPQSRSMPNYKFFHPRALRHTYFQKLFKIVVVKAEKILKNGNQIYLYNRYTTTRNLALLKSCRHCSSCPFVRYFRTLFWDDITIIWDENFVYLFNWEKKNCFGPNLFSFKLLKLKKKLGLMIYPLDRRNTKKLKNQKLKCWVFTNNSLILVKLFKKKPKY